MSNENSNIRLQLSPYPSVDFEKLYEKPNGTVNQSPVFIRTKVKNLNIDGYRTTMYIDESTSANQNKVFEVSLFFVKDAPITMMSAQTEPSLKENILSTFDQILSTFKFSPITP
jgi:hypothetical protein